jgi:serine O-acetyltransferase
MTGLFDLVRCIKQDFNRYTGGRGGARRFIYCYFSEPGLRAVFWFRVADYLHRHGLTSIARLMVGRTASKTGADIRIGARIGAGLLVHHPSGVVIGCGTVIGQNCTILQNVTLGERLGNDGDHNYPIIGDHVTLCAGAVVVGGVTIGPGSTVAANAVVLEDVPANSMAAGIPAKCKYAKKKMFSATSR